MKITATLDRIEGELAVLLLRGDEKIKFNLPVVFLDGIKEGDIVDITITKDAAATDEAKERVMSLILSEYPADCCGDKGGDLVPR